MPGVFGEFRGKKKVGEYTIELVDISKRLKKYRRINSEGEVEVSAVLPHDTVLLVEPAIPVFLPFQYESEAVMIRLTEPVYITPKTTSVFYLQGPLDYVVYDEDGEIVDIFSLDNPKYSIYGDPSNGVICRYSKSGVFTERDSNTLGKAWVPVKVQNSYSATLKVTLIVIPHRMIRLFYDDEGNSYYSVVKVELEDRDKAVVISDKQAPLRDLTPSRVDPFKRKGMFIPMEVGRFELEWGFSIPLTKLSPQS